MGYRAGNIPRRQCVSRLLGTSPWIMQVGIASTLRNAFEWLPKPKMKSKSSFFSKWRNIGSLWPMMRLGIRRTTMNRPSLPISPGMQLSLHSAVGRANPPSATN